MSQPIPEALRRDARERAGGRCEYCGVPEWAVLYPHEADHIIAVQHGGMTSIENLAFACLHCNRAKGPNIATVDDLGAFVRLFHPRKDNWLEHFEMREALIAGKTRIGNGTAKLLLFNAPQQAQVRLRLIRSRLWFQRLK